MNLIFPRPVLGLICTIFISLPITTHAQDSQGKDVAMSGAAASQAEVVRRQEALMRGRLLIKDGQNYLAQGDYGKAAQIFSDAQKLVPDSPVTALEADQIRKGLSVSLGELAKIAYNRRDYVSANAQAQQAVQLDPENRDAQSIADRAGREVAKVEDKKQKDEQEMAGMPPEVSNSDFVNKQKKVLELYRTAESYFKSEQFDQAETALKDILRIDPYSATAYHRLREVQLAKFKKLESAKMQTESESMLDVQRGWQMPLRRDRIVSSNKDENEDELGTLGGKTPILKKLNTILIKKIEFENTPILSAINYLVNESREADTSPSKEGVNIIPAFDTDRAGDGPKATPGLDTPGTAKAEDLSSRTVTLNLRNVPLLNAIKFLTQVTNLKYRIESDAVMIVSSEGLSTARTQTRTFSVAPGIFRSVIESSGGGGSGGSGGGKGGFQALGGNISMKAADVKKTFEDFGIAFPQGTSISYNEGLGVLVATHTNDVLDQIEQIILKLNKTAPQVQIEAKFIDVKETDLQELGFRWAFAPTTQQEYVVESGQGSFLQNLPINGNYRGLGNTISGGLRNSTQISISALDALLAGAGGNNGALVQAGANTLLTVTGLLTNPQFQMMLDAMAQKGMANLLSAPRVTTTSGEQAKILITREFPYPSAYTDPQVQAGTSSTTGGSGSVGIVAPSPTAFVSREVGVTLDVKPTVSSDSYTINLSLAPEVVDFEGFITYQTFAAAGGVTFAFDLKEPVFNKRVLNTNVVIWDGQTVLLGGLIREDVQKTEDKIPILGDIPLLGRLFQSKVENTIKRNLIIFLTARIVDPAGNPIRKLDEAKFSPPSPDMP